MGRFQPRDTCVRMGLRKSTPPATTAPKLNLVPGSAVQVDEKRQCKWTEARVISTGRHVLVELSSGRRVQLPRALVRLTASSTANTAKKPALDSRRDKQADVRPSSAPPPVDHVRRNMKSAGDNLGARAHKKLCSFAGPRYKDKMPYWARDRYTPFKLNPRETPPPRNSRGNLDFGDHIFGKVPKYLTNKKAEQAAVEEADADVQRINSKKKARRKAGEPLSGGAMPMNKASVSRADSQTGRKRTFMYGG